MNQYEYVSLEKKDHIIIVTINRQHYMNALHPPACRELDSIFDQFAEDPDSWVAIITGEGEKAFCAGNDLKWMTANGRDAYHREVKALKGGWGGITRRFNCYKPIIAAVNGLALGGGFELALACDIIIASENAKFGLPEPKVGMMASAGGINRLTRQIPYHIAMGYILTGKMMTASRSVSIRHRKRGGCKRHCHEAGRTMGRADIGMCAVVCTGSQRVRPEKL